MPLPAHFRSIIFLAVTGLSSAAPVTFLLDPGGGFDVTYSLSTGPTTTGRDELSGNIVADVRVTEIDEVEHFRLTGGRIAHADETMTLNVPPFYQVQFVTQGVATLPLTEGDGGYVNSATGELYNTGHRMISNEGSAITRYFAFGSQVGQETRDLATNPDSTALVGWTTLTLTVLDSTNWWKRARIDLVHSRDVTRTFPANSPILPAGTTYSVREDGGFTASGQGVFPGNDFIDWCELHRNLRPSDLESRDPRTGQPLLVMYAMRAAEETWSLPVEFQSAAGQLVLKLPPEGLQAPVKWELWSGNAEAAWVPLAGTPESGGIAPVATAGNVVVPLPTGTRGFVRASVPVPAE